MNNGHAVLPPSGSKRWMTCIASVYWANVLPPTADSIYSAEGTLIHDYGKKAVTLALGDKSPQKIYDKIGRQKHLDMTADWVDFCVRLHRKVNVVADSYPKYFVEQRVRMSEYIWGTLDFAIHFKKSGIDYLIGADLKTGGGVPVNVKNNTQLVLYLWGLCLKLKIEPAFLYMYIFQPRVYDKPQKQKLSWKEFKALVDEILEAEKRCLPMFTSKPKPKDYVPGDHCQFCPALSRCKAGKGRKKNVKKVTTFKILDDEYANEQLVKELENERRNTGMDGETKRAGRQGGRKVPKTRLGSVGGKSVSRTGGSGSKNSTGSKRLAKKNNARSSKRKHSCRKTRT